MARTTLPRVMLVEVDQPSTLTAAIEKVTRSCCRLVRATELSSPAAPRPDTDAADDPLTWKSLDVVAAILCAPTVDSRTEPGIVQRLSGLRGLLTLLVAETVDADVVARLLTSGVSDYVTTSGDEADLLPGLLRLLKALPRSNAPVAPRAKHGPPVGASKAFRKLLDETARAASCNANVLIQGETGAGKEVWARAIHDASDRADRPFVTVNCGALPRDLLENELFGHVKGAFTDATETRPGLLSEAEGGSIFLDEIDALPPDLQVKLLRVLQNGEFRLLGSTETLYADVRVFAASNTDLTLAVRTRRMRADLYYRLNVLHLTIPPLRERVEDILPLAEHFLVNLARKQERPVPELSAGADLRRFVRRRANLRNVGELSVVASRPSAPRC